MTDELEYPDLSALCQYRDTLEKWKPSIEDSSEDPS